MVEYRPVDGFPAYRVGSDGTIWSAWAYNGHQPRRLGADWRLLRARPDHDGYLALNLYREGRPHRRKVHLLVLEAFVGPRPSGAEGCHGDGRPENCALTNLRWDTKRANQNDRLRHGTDSRGAKSAKAKLTENLVRDILARLAAGARQADIARAFHISPSAVSGIKSGRLWGWLSSQEAAA